MGKKENDKRRIYNSFMFNYKGKIDNFLYIYF